MSGRGAGQTFNELMRAAQREACRGPPQPRPGDVMVCSHLFKGEAAACFKEAWDTYRLPEPAAAGRNGRGCARGGRGQGGRGRGVPEERLVRLIEILAFGEGSLPKDMAPWKGAMLDAVAERMEEHLRITGSRLTVRELLDKLRRRGADIPVADEFQEYVVPQSDAREALRGELGLQAKPTAAGASPGAFVGFYRGEVRFKWEHEAFIKTPPQDWADTVRPCPALWKMAVGSYVAEVECFEPAELSGRRGFRFEFNRDDDNDYILCNSAYRVGNGTALVNAPQINPFTEEGYRNGGAVGPENAHVFEVLIAGWPFLCLFTTAAVAPGEDLRYDYSYSRYFKHLADDMQQVMEKVRLEEENSRLRREMEALKRQLAQQGSLQGAATNQPTTTAGAGPAAAADALSADQAGPAGLVAAGGGLGPGREVASLAQCRTPVRKKAGGDGEAEGEASQSESTPVPASLLQRQEGWRQQEQQVEQQERQPERQQQVVQPPPRRQWFAGAREQREQLARLRERAQQAQAQQEEAEGKLAAAQGEQQAAAAAAERAAAALWQAGAAVVAAEGKSGRREEHRRKVARVAVEAAEQAIKGLQTKADDAYMALQAASSAAGRGLNDVCWRVVPQSADGATPGKQQRDRRRQLQLEGEEGEEGKQHQQEGQEEGSDEASEEIELVSEGAELVCLVDLMDGETPLEQELAECFANSARRWMQLGEALQQAAGKAVLKAYASLLQTRRQLDQTHSSAAAQSRQREQAAAAEAAEHEQRVREAQAAAAAARSKSEEAQTQAEEAGRRLAAAQEAAGAARAAAAAATRAWQAEERRQQAAEEAAQQRLQEAIAVQTAAAAGGSSGPAPAPAPFPALAPGPAPARAWRGPPALPALPQSSPFMKRSQNAVAATAAEVRKRVADAPLMQQIRLKQQRVSPQGQAQQEGGHQQRPATARVVEAGRPAVIDLSGDGVGGPLEHPKQRQQQQPGSAGSEDIIDLT